MTPVTSAPSTYYNFFKTTLKRSMTSKTQTTGIVLDPILDNDKVKIIFGSSFEVILTFIQGEKKEIISAGGFTQDADGNITLVDVTRDLPWDGASFSGGANPVKFTAKATVQLGITAHSLNGLAFRNGTNIWSAVNTFSEQIVLAKGSRNSPFASTGARDTAIPSPANGMSCFVTGLGQQVYNGGWQTLGAATVFNAANGTAGLVDKATLAEVIARTANDSTSGAINVLTADLVVTNSTGAAPGSIVGLNGDAQVDPTLSGLATGIISPYAGSAAPNGWLLCYGQAVSRTTYANLYAITSTTYGAGDGATTFNLPDLRGRFPLGKDNMGGSSANRVTHANADVLGGVQGVESIDISHTHTQTTETANNAPGYGYQGSLANQLPTTNSSLSSTQNIMNPYMAINYIIKT